MFLLSDIPLDPLQLKKQLTDEACGAFVSFEGWVRNCNEGKAVLRLEYEAYDAVALREGAKIVSEHGQRSGASSARCVHRVGSLSPGDLAVWVGVVSPHRDEAFQACRKIIDDIKHLVPIWKKEHYTDGNSGWVNCERCAHHGDAHTQPPMPGPETYYSRQICLPEVGVAGQERLANTRVLVVGAGGLAAGLLPPLAAAGFGTIGICDGDDVDTSNLHRQTLFTTQDIGMQKAVVAAARLRALNPNIKCLAHPFMLEASQAQSLIPDYDLILDCTDNFETKFLLNDYAVRLHKPLIQASIYQYEGQLFTFHPDDDSACMRCLWPSPPPPGCVASCAEVGVFGAVPAILGSMQAMESIKQVLGLPDRLRGEMLYMDLLSYRTRRVTVARNPTCSACGTLAPHRTPAPDIAADITIDPKCLSNYTLVDVRERSEAVTAPLDGIPHLAWPTSLWQQGCAPLLDTECYVLCCTHGRRSRQLAHILREQGLNVYSLRGGLRTWLQTR